MSGKRGAMSGKRGAVRGKRGASCIALAAFAALCSCRSVSRPTTAAATPVAGPVTATRPAPPDRTYRFIVGAESDDEVALIEFRPCPFDSTGALVSTPGCGARTLRTYQVGLYPSDIEGPHGVVASNDGRSFYVSIAHGRPTGYLQKFDFATGKLIDQVELGMFPATVDIAPLGELVYVINFNFEDPEMQPSSLSIVDGETMLEVARPTTCRMPHGSRLNPQGTRHYSGCMMNDLLVEVSARGFEVTRTLNVAPHAESREQTAAQQRAGNAQHAHGSPDPAISNRCSPTWAQPSADGSKVYVACNAGAEIVEVDVDRWTVSRRWKTPAAPYNLAVTPDGALLVATQKGPGTVSIWRLRDATLLADIPGTRKVASGVAVSPDSRYAFATLEGIGGDPGTVDIIDLAALKKVASVTVGKQAGGIAVVTAR